MEKDTGHIPSNNPSQMLKTLEGGFEVYIRCSDGLHLDSAFVTSGIDYMKYHYTMKTVILKYIRHVDIPGLQ